MTNELPGNPHYKAPGAWESADIDPATQAILAVAHELRTANLIASVGLIGANLNGWPENLIKFRTELVRDIQERLGLSGEESGGNG